MNEKMREKIAAFCHDSQWSGWMRYIFEKCMENKDGTLTIPKWAVERWRRQMVTTYVELSEYERDSDRKEADAFIDILASLNLMVPVEEECPHCKGTLTFKGNFCRACMKIPGKVTRLVSLKDAMEGK